MPWTAKRVRYADVARLAGALDCPEPMAWVLVRRGLADPEDAAEFLRADGPLDPPEAIPGIAEAADRVVRAVRAGERIVVHGDYDCDGICSTAILVRALRGRGADVRAFLPSRFDDGYGVALHTVERLADEGCDLLITVDCGTTAVEALTLARDLGIESVVCDHHLAGGHRPPAIIANPALGRGVDVLPAAAGVAYKLVRAMAARMDAGTLGPDPDEALDLVALATVADAVPLVGENRRLVARGLAAIHAGPRPGIAALCQAAGVPARSATARDLGWNLAPAINAAGRMSHPVQALELLLAEDDGFATRDRAVALWELNMERREVEQRVTAEAIAIIDASPPEVREAHALVVAGEGWHEGVVGIVASRLVERFGRPAIVVSISDALGKGSGRSVPGVDLHALVSGAASRLHRWGGHAGAIGLQLAHDDVAAFRDELAEAAAPLGPVIRRAAIRAVDAVVGVRELSLRTAEALEEMQPFGNGNPEVRLAVPAALVEAAGTVGADGRHLQVRLRAGGAHARAMGWRMGARAAQVPVGERTDALVQLGIERWQDMVGPRVTLEALEPLTDGASPDAPVPEGPPGDARLALERPTAPPGAPRAVRDRRGTGIALATITALCGADDGVLAVVCDADVRAPLLAGPLATGRLAVRGIVLRPERVEIPAEPVLALVGYDVLPQVRGGGDLHVVLVDPPPDAGALAWARRVADGRWLHAVWGDDETEVARAVAAERGALRAVAAAVWTALRDAGPLAWRDLDGVLDARGVTPSRTARARAIAALCEIGRLTVDGAGVRIADGDPALRLEDAPTAVAAAAIATEQRAFLANAATLDIGAGALSLEDVRAG